MENNKTLSQDSRGIEVETQNGKAKKYKMWSRILLIVGLLGLIDIVTHSLVEESYGLTDVGYVSIGFLLLFKYLFGLEVASTLFVFVSIFFTLWFLWLAIAYSLSRRAKLIENPSDQNKKKFARAKIIIYLLGGLMLIGVLFGILLVLF